eukprot:6479996-Amphidinium_carterae.1
MGTSKQLQPVPWSNRNHYNDSVTCAHQVAIKPCLEVVAKPNGWPAVAMHVSSCRSQKLLVHEAGG